MKLNRTKEDTKERERERLYGPYGLPASVNAHRKRDEKAGSVVLFHLEKEEKSLNTKSI